VINKIFSFLELSATTRKAIIAADDEEDKMKLKSRDKKII
jgi:hypothetical protein